jgi:hypothetical protein
MRHIQEGLTIHNLENNICSCEAIGLGKCFIAYGEYAKSEYILEGGIGFNPNSGYTYIALENGISICSMLGRDVEYLVTNMNNGEEHFFDTYEEAENFDTYALENED